MRKFWNWVRNADEERTLYLNGPIAEETWWGDEVTPKVFKDELLAGSGSISVWINSPGGDVFAAAQIYNMLMNYKVWHYKSRWESWTLEMRKAAREHAKRGFR